MQELQVNKDSQIQDMEKVKIVTMLYEGAINFTKTAIAKMHDGDRYGVEVYTDKASAIVSELSRALDMSAGEVSQNLKRLYDFVFTRLSQAKSKNDPIPLNEALKVLEILREGWTEVEKKIVQDSAR
jgi:flagellar protein FliS